MSQKLVAIVMGSDSDWPVMEKCYNQLADLSIDADVRILSAHRTPGELVEWIKASEAAGIEVFIAGAGMAAALPGVVAGHTTKPVIGIPLISGSLAGVDALMSIVQMPPGIPVATVAVGGAGARNAAILAAQMLALSNKTIDKAVKEHRANQATAVLSKNAALQDKLK